MTQTFYTQWQSSVLADAETMQNKGLEIHLSAIPVQTKEFSWTTSFNYSTNKNKLVALSNEEFQLKSGYIEDGWTGEPIQQYTHRIFEGGEVGNFYGFKTIDKKFGGHLAEIIVELN